MYGLIKPAVATFLITAGLCCAGIVVSAAEEDLEYADTSGKIPLYILQLIGFSTIMEEHREKLKPEILEYQIQPGDSLYSIALRFDTDIETITRLNKMANPHHIAAGAIIDVLTVSGSVHSVENGETISCIADKYGVEEEVILSANDLDDVEHLRRGQRVIVPGAFLDRGGYGFFFQWPLQGRLTSGYGLRGSSFHYGIDIGAPVGTPFYAASGGTVVYAGYLGLYGLMVDVSHENGYLTRYAHAGSLEVSSGQKVFAGQVLGYVGLTGNTTGPHLHFELHRHGEKLNPLHYLK